MQWDKNSVLVRPIQGRPGYHTSPSHLHITRTLRYCAGANVQSLIAIIQTLQVLGETYPLV